MSNLHIIIFNSYFQNHSFPFLFQILFFFPFMKSFQHMGGIQYTYCNLPIRHNILPYYTDLYHTQPKSVDLLPNTLQYSNLARVCSSRHAQHAANKMVAFTLFCVWPSLSGLAQPYSSFPCCQPSYFGTNCASRPSWPTRCPSS